MLITYDSTAVAGDARFSFDDVLIQRGWNPIMQDSSLFDALFDAVRGDLAAKMTLHEARIRGVAWTLMWS